MAICVDLISGTLQSNGQSEVDCTAYLLHTALEYQSQVGFFQGVTLTDTIEVSGLVVACWATAWGIKSVRRAL